MQELRQRLVMHLLTSSNFHELMEGFDWLNYGPARLDEVTISDAFRLVRSSAACEHRRVMTKSAAVVQASMRLISETHERQSLNADPDSAARRWVAKAK